MSIREIGKFGENLAKEYLEKKGYKIMEENFRTRYGEIDLVAKKGDEIIFVEVKTRTNEVYGPPEEAITPKKQLKLAQTAEQYLESHQLTGTNFRIDSLAILLNRATKTAKIRHLKSVVGGYY